MRGALLILLPLLAACADTPRDDIPRQTGEAVSPGAVILYRDTVTVAMRDGSFCAGVRPGAAGPWTAMLAGCPHRWPVEVRRTTERPRLPLSAAADAPWVVLSPPDRPELGFAPAIREGG